MQEVMKISFFLVLGILKAKTDFRMLIFSYSVPPFKRTYWCSTMLCWYVLLLLKKKEEEEKEKKCTLLLCFVSFEPLSLHLSWFTLIENQNERDVHNPPPSHNPWCTFFFSLAGSVLFSAFVVDKLNCIFTLSRENSRWDFHLGIKRDCVEVEGMDVSL